MLIQVPVIIVGGGPAGSAAAIVFKRLKVPYMVITAPSHSGGKVCAGGLTSKAISALNRLQTSKKDYQPNEINRIKIFDGASVIYNRPLLKEFYIADRGEFDYTLCVDAQPEDIALNGYGYKVHDIDYINRTITVDGTTYEYEHLILADGIYGNGSKLVGIANKNFCIQVAIPRGYDNTTVQVYFNHIKGGYGYVFPNKTCDVVGIGCSYDEDFNYSDALLEFCDSLGYEASRKDFRGMFIPAHNEINFNAIPPRVMVCGDAIGHASPLTGEGISYALNDGIAAAESIAYFLNDANAARASYQVHCAKTSEELKHHQRLVKFMSLPPNLLSKALKACGKHPNFLRTCLEDGMFDAQFGITDLPSAVRYYLYGR